MRYILLVSYLMISTFGFGGKPVKSELLKVYKQAENFLSVPKNNKNFLLSRCSAASLYLRIGDLANADLALSEAITFLDATNIGVARGRASLVSRESIKFFRGEPYERAMIYIYKGIIDFSNRLYNKARIDFERSLLEMSQGSSDVNGSLLTISHAFLSQVYYKLYDMQRARVAYEKIKDKVNLSFEEFLSCNGVVLVHVGITPWKENDVWTASDLPGIAVPLENHCKVLLQSSGGSEINISAFDGINFIDCIKHLVRTNKDSVQKTKGSITAGAMVLGQLVAPFAIVAAMLNVAGWTDADLRTWFFLSSKIYIAFFKVEPGNYTLTLKFSDDLGLDLAKFRVRMPSLYYSSSLEKNIVFCYSPSTDKLFFGYQRVGKKSNVLIKKANPFSSKKMKSQANSQSMELWKKYCEGKCKYLFDMKKDNDAANSVEKQLDFSSTDLLKYPLIDRRSFILGGKNCFAMALASPLYYEFLGLWR